MMNIERVRDWFIGDICVREEMVLDTTECEDVMGICLEALEEIQQLRAIGTVEGYEDAIQSSIENYNLYREYKAKVQDFESIGTIEEFKALKEKNTPMELAEHNFQDEPHHYLCPMCKNIVDYMQNYCEECGQALEGRLAMKGENLWNIVLEK